MRRNSSASLGEHPIAFDCEHDLSFRNNEVLPRHPIGIRFVAYNWGKQTLACRFVYSTGGGFATAEGNPQSHETIPSRTPLPYPFKSASDLLRLGQEHQKPISALVLANENPFLPTRGGGTENC